MQRFLHHVRSEIPDAAETAAGARERLRDKFPRAALRRMTHLGLLAGSALDGLALAPEDALVYATSFAEARALEDYLASFPTPSPLLFQTSIHPSGVQQVLIGRQQPVSRLWPLAGRARLIEQMLLTALLETAPRVTIVGGEERGTWLLEQGWASDRSFAFAALLTHDAAGAVGRVVFEPAEPSDAAGPQAEDAPPPLADFADALQARRALSWRGGGGTWALHWQ